MQKPIELILTRQLTSGLAMPVFLVDEVGTLVFYNEAAERALGIRFEETGEMPASEWSTRWRPTDERGTPLAPETLPLAIALVERRPASGSFSIRGLDGTNRRIQVSAIPLVRADDHVVGAIAFFWEAAS